jgi:hypothetical protein
MFRTKCFVFAAAVVAICLAAGTRASATVILSDNFNTTGGINADLSTRQSGSEATSTWDDRSHGNGVLDVETNMFRIHPTSGNWTSVVDQAGWEDKNLSVLTGKQWEVSALVDMDPSNSGAYGIVAIDDDHHDVSGKMTTGAYSLFAMLKGDAKTWSLTANNNNSPVTTSGVLPSALWTCTMKIVADEAAHTAALYIDGSQVGTTISYINASTDRFVGMGYRPVAGNGYARFDDLSVTATIPEPGALVLSISGLLGLLAYAWRKRR